MTMEAGNAHIAAPPAPGQTAWIRSCALFVLATALLVALHFNTVATMINTWMISDTYGYGFLILPLVGFLVYQRRAHLAQLTPRPCFWAIIWIAGALLLQMVGTIASIMLFQQIAFVALWQGLFALIMGWAVSRQLLFALFYVYFTVPVGEEAVPYLQTITAEITAPLLRASGIPTFHDGVYIEIPTGSFIVAEVCSGARFLITSLVLGTLVSNLFFRTWPRRLIFIALCLVVPILTNGLRAYGIILLAHLSDNAIAIAVDHVIYGLVFLSFVLIILTGLGALFRDRWPGDETLEPAPQGAPSRVSAGVGATLLGAMILFGGSYWTKQATVPPETATMNLAAVAPSANWKASEPPTAGWSPSFPGADTQLLRSYTNASGEVSFFIGHYRYQRIGHEVIAVTNTFSGGTRDDQVTRFEKFEVEVGSGRKTVRETLVKSPRGSRLIWSWYEIGGTATISPFTGKFLEIWHALSGGSRSATAYALSTEAGDDVRQPRARLAAFLAAIEATRDALATTPRTSTQIADSDAGILATSTTTKER